jgi:hypothetical protein
MYLYPYHMGSWPFNIPKKGATESLLRVNLHLVKINAIPDLTFPLVYESPYMNMNSIRA